MPKRRVWIMPEACSISPSSPTTAAFPYASMFAPPPANVTIRFVSISPNDGPSACIPGFRSSTNRPAHGFVTTAATAKSRWGGSARLKPSMRVSSSYTTTLRTDLSIGSVVGLHESGSQWYSAGCASHCTKRWRDPSQHVLPNRPLCVRIQGINGTRQTLKW